MIDPFLYFLLFLKATLFSSGGFSNLPSLHQDLIARQWARQSDFGESLAIGQVSPGPNGLWVIGLGYLTYGVLGAAFSLVALTVPPLLVLGVAAIYTRIEHQRWVPGLMRGISLAVVSTFIAVFWTIIGSSGQDWTGWLICFVAFGLAMSKRVNIPLILALAAVAGYFLYR
jgi:chromate transporter